MDITNDENQINQTLDSFRRDWIASIVKGPASSTLLSPGVLLPDSQMLKLMDLAAHCDSGRFLCRRRLRRSDCPYLPGDVGQVRYR